MQQDKQESPLTFPKRADKNRLDKYAYYDKLYSGEHFDAFSIAAQDGFNTVYARLRYVVANFAGLASRVLADMLFGETITIDVKDKDLQNFLDAVQEKNGLFNQFYESELVNSRKGDDVFKLRVGPRNPKIPDSPSEIIIEQIGPEFYFPQFSKQTGRGQTDEDVIVTQFSQLNESTGRMADYIHKEIHTPGLIQHEVYQYNLSEQKIISQEDVTLFGWPEEEPTGVDRSLVFHIPNVRDGAGFWGTSDYNDLQTLFFALNNRITKTDNILDKHSDPILAVPPGVLDEDGNVKKESLGMFEVDNETGAKPEYIVWNANLDVAFKEIDKLVDFLFMFGEIAPAAFGLDNGGQAESGRALKFKLLATIRKRNRKKRYYDQAIKDMLVTSMELAKAHSVQMGGVVPAKIERPTIAWGSGIIPDETEEIDNATKRIDAGLSSRADEIARIDDVTPDEAQKKVKEIDEEARANMPPAIENNLTGNPPAPNPQNPQPNTQPAPPAK